MTLYRKYGLNEMERGMVQQALVRGGGTLLPSGEIQAPVTGYWPVREWAWNGTLWSDAAGLVSTRHVFWPVPDTQDSPQGLGATEVAEYVRALCGGEG